MDAPEQVRDQLRRVDQVLAVVEHEQPVRARQRRHHGRHRLVTAVAGERPPDRLDGAVSVGRWRQRSGDGVVAGCGA